MLLRPDAIILPGGKIEKGLEVTIAGGKISRIEPWTSENRKEKGLLLSAAFVNAHSHLEYFDLQDSFSGLPYWSWIRSLTIAKSSRDLEYVAKQAKVAATLNVNSGVTAIGEHCDWTVCGKAIHDVELDGRIFQELIVLTEHENPYPKLELVYANARESATQSNLPTLPSPHATYTVVPNVLSFVGSSFRPLSIHAAETEIENIFFEKGEGEIAELYRKYEVPIKIQNCTAIEHLHRHNCLHSSVQLVHCCAASDSDILLMAKERVTVAHCPRSNAALQCPPAQIAKMRRLGIKVGIGLDSAASSGEINYFDEMRSALATSIKINDPLAPGEIYDMATHEGANSIFLNRNWKTEVGGQPDLLLLNGERINSVAELIEQGNPDSIVEMIRIRGVK